MNKHNGLTSRANLAMKLYPIAGELSGPTAMWTRPDTGDAPVSYPAPSYEAVEGIFESIVWLKSYVVRDRKKMGRIAKRYAPTEIPTPNRMFQSAPGTKYRGPES